MRFVMFYHSVVSDWNHGNAHFLRGVATELLLRGHDVQLYEPADGWSVQHLLEDRGRDALAEFRVAYPLLQPIRYDLDRLDVARALDRADVVLVHEWNDPDLVARIGRQRSGAPFRLFFHDTHHRSLSAPHEIDRLDLRDYDGVLAFGDVIRHRYLEHGWTQRAWCWHEAADTHLFRPIDGEPIEADVVWIGNWGDGERDIELSEYLIEPVRALGLHGTAYGVRYPDDALRRLADAGVRFAGSLPNYAVPRAFARHRVTLHVPRRPYVRDLPGIPTIRVFEALACGIPLLCAPWDDAERLFQPGSDYLVARNGGEMRRHLHDVLNDDDLAASLAQHGRATILERHTCAHRVDELLRIMHELTPRQKELITS